MKHIFYFLAFLVLSLEGRAQEQAFISTQNALEDIDFLVKSIEEIHYNPYFSISKDEFNSTKQELFKDFDSDSITYRKFIATGMQLTSLLSGGHTNLYWKNEIIVPELKNYTYLPFTGRLNSDGHFVVTKSNIESIKSGDTISEVNGLSMVELYSGCMGFTGGIPAYKNETCSKVFPLYLFYLNKIKAPYAIQIKNHPNSVSSDGLDVTTFLNFINTKSAKENYTFEILENDIGLISYNSCTDYKAFKKFLASTFKEINQKKISKLVIDIRNNGGGDSGLNDLLLNYLTTKQYQQASGRYWKVSQQAKNTFTNNPAYKKGFGEEFMNQYSEAKDQSVIKSMDEDLITPQSPKNYFEGTSCFLIGPGTFSSANFLADAIKTYNLSTLIGNPTGENTNDFGEMIQFSLPNSKCDVFVSTTYDIGANGNADLFQPVSPDIQVEKDVLNFAIKWLKEQDN